tara:strand:- start:1156 stop:1509 length:354 start_codon:yes stop_codon:yes gene_type:complete
MSQPADPDNQAVDPRLRRAAHKLLADIISGKTSITRRYTQSKRFEWNRELRSTKRGLRRYPCKLTPEQVREIRRLWPDIFAASRNHLGAEKTLAAMYSVTSANIKQIIQRKTWKNLD